MIGPLAAGDRSTEYLAVRERAGLIVRSDLVRFRLWGRDPGRMLQGLITNDLVGAPEGRGVYGAMLTAKGRTIADLRAFRLPGESGGEILIDLAEEAAAGTREHLRKFVPPLFARWEEITESTSCIGVYGPLADAVLAELVGLQDLPAEEDAFTMAAWKGERIVVIRTRYAGLEDGCDLVAPAAITDELWTALRQDERTEAIAAQTLETLRIEAGRPRYGRELTEEAIPTEAFQETGLLERAISFSKGCYTGQEVIVRIAHRGHVNRHLRGLLLGELPLPEPKTPLYHPESGKEVGWTTSAVRSPLMEQSVALGFVRREVSPGQSVRLGTADGAAVSVTRLPFTRETR